MDFKSSNDSNLNNKKIIWVKMQRMRMRSYLGIIKNDDGKNFVPAKIKKMNTANKQERAS
jgi:hypothetical protein